MPFIPGQSGNPAGRPKGTGTTLHDLVREATNDGQDPVDFLLKVLAGRIKHVKIEHRIMAAKELLDRGYGKPAQTHEVSGPEAGPVEVRFIIGKGYESDQPSTAPNGANSVAAIDGEGGDPLCHS